jgi:enoyl-CoA hydratase/carnithine racemase
MTRGLVAGSGAAFSLRYHIAMELILIGRTLTAARARELGLVNELVPTGGALEAARDLALVIAGHAPQAAAASKPVVVESQDWPLAKAFERQEAIIGPVRQSADAAEGARAFAEKRAPGWRAQ